MAIYLVRHGSDDDKYRGGWSELGLTEEGIEQSKQLGKYLSKNGQKYQIDTLISSDLRRAIETVSEIEIKLNISAVLSPEWRETNNGDLAGMLNSEALIKYPGLFFSNLQMDQQYPGGESPMEFYKRIKDSFYQLSSEIIDGKIGPNVMIVTHGGVINIIYYIINKLEWTNKSPAFCKISNTGIHSIEYIEDNWKVVQSNQIEHLL